MQNNVEELYKTRYGDGTGPGLGPVCVTLLSSLK